MALNLSKWLRFKLLFPALAYLPRGIGYRIADLIGRRDACRHLTQRAVKLGMEELYPDLRTDRARGDEYLLRHFQMLARDTLDCFLMPRFTAKNTAGLIKVRNIEILSAARSAGRGVIMIISHYGRFFMLGPGLKFAGEEFGMLTTMIDERHPTYDAVDRWYMAKKLHNTQIFSGGTWITTADDPRKVYRCLKAGEIILFALDGNETISNNRISFPFAGGTISLPEGLVRIAAATGCKLVYAASQDQAWGVEITIHPLPDEPTEALAAAVALLERDMRMTPWHWWLWAGLGSFWRTGNEATDGKN